MRFKDNRTILRKKMIDLDNGTEFEIDIISLEEIAETLTKKDIELLIVKKQAFVQILYLSIAIKLYLFIGRVLKFIRPAE